MMSMLPAFYCLLNSLVALIAPCIIAYIFAFPTFRRNNSNNLNRAKFVYDSNLRVIRYGGFSYGGCRELSKDVQIMTEEEFAKEVLKAAAASQNNDKAKKVVIDYAKQEILDGDHDDTINEIVSDINSDTNTQPNPTDNPTDNKDTDNNPSANPQTNPQTDKPKPKDDGGNFELPPFCSWASHVCRFIDWVKQDPDLGEPDKIDIPVQDRDDLAQQDINKQYYDAVGQCPAPAVVNTNFGQIKIPYDTLCNFFARHSPILIAIAYLIGGYIVIGRK